MFVTMNDDSIQTEEWSKILTEIAKILKNEEKLIVVNQKVHTGLKAIEFKVSVDVDPALTHNVKVFESFGSESAVQEKVCWEMGQYCETIMEVLERYPKKPIPDETGVFIGMKEENVVKNEKFLDVKFAFSFEDQIERF